MPTIAHLLVVPSVGGYYCEDLAALQSRPMSVAERYAASGVTPGFRRVREVAEAVSVGLVLDDGHVAWGDCVAVAYSGKAGRWPVFRADEGIAAVRQVVAPALAGQSVAEFRALAAKIDGLMETVVVERPAEAPQDERAGGVSRRDLLTGRFLRTDSEDSPRMERVAVTRPLHTAVRYGVSQALLQAAALARGLTMAEVIADEWGLPLPSEPVPIHAQSGGERYANVDKMIARRVASLPHALVDNIPEQLGSDGSELVQYARWVKERIQALAGSDYQPTIHLDVHGALGQVFDNNLGKVLGVLYALETAVRPYALRVECPVMMDSRDAQIDAMRTLRQYVRARGMHVQLVADEWANTLDDIRAFVDAQSADMIQVKMPDLGSVHNAVDAVLVCKQGGVGAFLGGSCAETDISSRVSVHVALAARPDIVMAKPGMGVDEAVMLAQNEMGRVLAEIRHRRRANTNSTGSTP
ncbi:MAG: methylaspartate ammonia-lyase [Anaerolineae bacterium]|nr:methylaspartate ammonia-lyase [Anaerolineae bacterium]